MRHLQDLYAKHRNEGLVVVGINPADTKQIATGLLEQDGVEFPNVLDSSMDANRAMMKYETLTGMSAVPMTYLIDRQGLVMDAWYGFDKKKREAAIKRLKLEEER